jgi:hypothetical protein
MIEIHEFSTGISFVGEPDNWKTTGFRASYINSTLEEIPIAVEIALRKRDFSVSERWRGDRCIIGSEVNLNNDSWSVIAVITIGKDNCGRILPLYRYFLSQGLGKLPDILFWYTEIANEPVFNPFDKKEMGKPHLYDISLTKIDDLILDRLTSLKTARFGGVNIRGQEITEVEITEVEIISNRLISVMNVCQLASQVSTNNGLVFRVYSDDSFYRDDFYRGYVFSDDFHNVFDFSYLHFYGFHVICSVIYFVSKCCRNNKNYVK